MIMCVHGQQQQQQNHILLIAKVKTLDNMLRCAPLLLSSNRLSGASLWIPDSLVVVDELCNHVAESKKEPLPVVSYLP